MTDIDASVVRERRVSRRQRFANKEMSQSECFDLIIIAWLGDERSTFQNSFDLYKDCGGLLSCEFYIRDYVSVMGFHALHCRFP
jgi:hypothetical protein